MASIRLEGVCKVFPGGHVALDGVDLDVPDGGLLVLVGPSGCGKSTALRIIAGLESPTRGRVWLGERDVTALLPGERDVAMVFQSYALYPHKTVRENLAFGLRVRRVPAPVREQRVLAVARRLGLEDLLDRRPAQLSGGERQRVALGRALAREPVAFLLDEPLSNLDARLRVETRRELARLHRDLGATLVHVTHDQEEAMTLGDRIAVLRNGRLEQVGAPLEVYRRPATAFVAEFIGSPAINWLDARIDGSGTLSCEPLRLRVRGAGAPAGAVRLGIRPQHLALVAPGAGAPARVEFVEELGGVRVVHALLDGAARPVAVLDAGDTPRASGAPVAITADASQAHLFAPVGGSRLDFEPAAGA
jgi:sn-glycerol 3-phosphate transport system ATP-binding protein